MKRPVCCGILGKPYRKFYIFYGRVHSVEFGFNCKKCGRIRLPFEVDGSAYLAELEGIRQKLIESGEILIDNS
jgi:hypothetical protein